MTPSTSAVWWRALRASNVPTVWTNVLLGTLLALPPSQSVPNWWSLLLVLIGGSCAYLAGMAHNDLCDEALDVAHNTPRPLGQSELTRRAMQWAMSLLLVGFISAIAAAAFIDHRFTLTTAGLTIGLFLAIMGYNVLHRWNAALATVLMAACRGLLVLLAAHMAGGLNTPSVLIAAGAVAFWTAGITLLARGERGQHATVGGWMLFFGIAPLGAVAVGALGGTLLGATIGGLLVLYGAWIPVIWRRYANGQHVPAVVWSILGLSVLDAALLLAANQLVGAGIAMVCMAVCVLLQRRSIGT
jgi:4-hydroxybenzoate polyprenyltransferase